MDKEWVLLTEKNFSRLKEFVKKNEGKKIIFSSEDDDLNRKVIERLPINVLLILLSDRKDFMKQRNSGFNDVMAKISRKNGIKMGINLDELVFSLPAEKERILSRLKQNVKICNRNKIEFVFVGRKEKRNLYLLRSLGLVLGMQTRIVKNLDFIYV